MTRLFISILVISWIAVAAIGILAQPDEGSETYWLAVAWCEVLITLNWFVSASFFSGGNAARGGGFGSVIGALPGINGAVFVYTIISFFMLIIFYNSGFSSSTHISWQVVLGAVTAILVLLMLVAAKGATAGLETQVSKSDILEECRRIERAGPTKEVEEAVRDIKNFVSYKMIHPAKLNQEKLISLYQDLKTLTPTDTEKASSLRSTLKQI